MLQEKLQHIKVHINPNTAQLPPFLISQIALPSVTDLDVIPSYMAVLIFQAMNGGLP